MYKLSWSRIQISPINMKNILLFLLGTLLAGSTFTQENRSYKDMMYDPSVNFYDVCAAAESYFSTHDPSVKGSGWMGYQRWRDANEYKFYPTGDRSNVDPAFAEKAYLNFLSHSSNANQRLFNAGWEELGPSKVDRISGHYAVGLGRVEDIYVNPNDTSNIYIGSRSGGFWKTTDDGATWIGGSTDFLVASGVNTIAVSPTNTDSILINVQNSNNQYSHGIYRSVDGGASWAISNFNPTNVGFGGLGSNFRVYRIAYHPDVPNLVFVGTNKGLYRSTDNLQTWTRIFNSGEFTQIEFHPTNPARVYTLDNRSSNNLRDYLLISSDTGNTYVQSSQIPNNSNSFGKLSLSAACPNCVYFCSGNGIWKSINEGQQFTFISNPAVGTGGFGVNDQDTSNMIIGTIDVFAANNGGQSFGQVTDWYLGSAFHGPGTFLDKFQNSTAYVHADMRLVRSMNGTFYITTDGYIAKSNDNGQNWRILSEGTPIRENYRLGTSQSNHYRTICGSQDNGTSIVREDGWLEFYGADGMEGLIHPLNDDWMIGSFQNGGRRRTTDGGFSQNSVTPSGQSGSGNADWLAPILYDPNNQMRVLNFSQSVRTSDDFGDNWSFTGSPTSFSGNIRHAAIAENNSDIVLVARNENIDKSTDGGQTFVSIRNNLPNQSIQDIAFDPRNDDNIVVVYARYQNDGQKVFRTTDGGASWLNITNNLGNMPIRSVVIDHSDSSNIYLGAEIGVYVMPWMGNNWALYNTDLPNTTIREMEINYGSNTVKAVTWGRGLWEFALKDRIDYPAIVRTRINDLPTIYTPKEGIDQFVTSVISYDNQLSSVYTEWSANAPTFGNVIPMSNTSDSTWVSNTAIPNFPIGTKMYFKVFAVGANSDTTETYKFMYEVREFEYCLGAGSGGTGSDYISNMELNGVSNPSGLSFYADYTNILIDLFADSTYTLMIELGAAFAQDSGKAWIDYDGDATFEETEAIIMSTYDANRQAFGVFTVPTNLNVGDTVVMRLRNAYNAIPDPCGVVAGEVEDYGIVLRSNLVNLEERGGLLPVSLFPNPSQGAFRIRFEDPQEWFEVRISDLSGKIVQQQRFVGQQTEDFQLDTPAGVYQVEVESPLGRRVFKLLKQL